MQPFSVFVFGRLGKIYKKHVFKFPRFKRNNSNESYIFTVFHFCKLKYLKQPQCTISNYSEFFCKNTFYVYIKLCIFKNIILDA